jgi:type II secretory pathway predicted ATPase ExeA
MTAIKTNSVTITEHFGCRYVPFSDTFPIKAPWLSKADEINLHRMEGLLSQGKSLSLVGEPGTGKSMLLKTLIGRLDAKVFRTVLIPWAGQKPGQILREICDKIRLDTAGRTPLIQRLHKALARSADAPYTVLVIDEAHNLPREAFQEIFSLTADHANATASASIVLAGHPVLSKILDLDINAAVKSRIAMRFRTTQLEEEEVESFVKFRLKAAGAQEALFEKDAYATLHIDSKGNRRAIMNIAGNAMDLAMERAERIVADDIVREVAMNY